MKNVFKKSYLPLIDRAVHHPTDADAAYSLYFKMRTEDGLDRLVAPEVLLLTRAAERGDARAISELARHYYFDYGTEMIPYALSWWRRAILTGSDTVVRELAAHRGEMYRRILAYGEGKSDFGNIVMKCAMLAEYILFEFGLADWARLSNADRLLRCRTLVEVVSPILGIRPPAVNFVRGLSFVDEYGTRKIAYGLANPDWSLDILEDMVDNREWLVQVLFHELGHFVCFSCMGNSDNARRMRKIYGVTEERSIGWNRGDRGIEIRTSEEDPDTLSYSTYTAWAVLFADPTN